MAGEELPEALHVVAGEGEDLLVRHGGEVGTVGHRVVDHALVVDELGEVLLGEDPAERLVDAVGVSRALIGGPGLVRRRVGRAEQALVHELGRETRCADGEDARDFREIVQDLVEPLSLRRVFGQSAHHHGFKRGRKLRNARAERWRGHIDMLRRHFAK